MMNERRPKNDGNQPWRSGIADWPLSMIPFSSIIGHQPSAIGHQSSVNLI
jgi:hypothetical protein